MMFAMESMMKKQKNYVSNTNTNTTTPNLSMHKNSHLVTKAKPKIRIIHIFAPEIIKTDVANFRELVQRLTGKPTENDIHMNNNKKRTKPRYSKRVELRPSRFSEFRERIKGEDQEVWGDGINQNSIGGGFLGGFAEMDGFMQELNEFHLLPIDAGTICD